MDMSFQEKSILGSLCITVSLFGLYFIKVFEVVTSGSSESLLSLPFALIGIVVAVVAVEIVYHVTIALISRRDAEAAADERDKLIEAKATQISYYILAAGCVTTVGHMLIAGYLGSSFIGPAIEPIIVAANMLVFSFILAESVGFGMQLYYYRRGI